MTNCTYSEDNELNATFFIQLHTGPMLQCLMSRKTQYLVPFLSLFMILENENECVNSSISKLWHIYGNDGVNVNENVTDRNRRRKCGSTWQKWCEVESEHTDTSATQVMHCYVWAKIVPMAIIRGVLVSGERHRWKEFWSKRCISSPKIHCTLLQIYPSISGKEVFCYWHTVCHILYLWTHG